MPAARPRDGCAGNRENGIGFSFVIADLSFVIKLPGKEITA
jgi:hypothetical protein